MKRRFLTFCMILLLLCAFPVDSFAEQYFNLGQISTGQSVKIPISILPPGVSFTSDPLPSGCSLSTETINENLALYLSGSPDRPDSYRFNIYVGDGSEKLMCAINVVAGVPAVSTSADVDCYMGDPALLSVSANSYSGGTLSYQWYANGVPSNQGGTVILGATSAELTADTHSAGTTYYYCEVADGLSQPVLSSPIRVSVGQLTVNSIMVNTMPTKTRYLPGEYFDPLGLSILLNLSSGEVRQLDAGYQISPQQLTQPGQQIITVSYDGKSCSFPVTVLSEEDLVSGIGMVSLPLKTEYQTGEMLDPTGLVFRAWAQDGSYRDLSDGFTCDPMLLDRAGSQTITLTYAKKTCTFTVNVSGGAQVLEVSSTPRKLSYAPGEALDTTGLVLKLGDQIIRSGYTCEPMVLTGSGTQVIKVRYNNQVATFTVSVKAASPATPTPQITPTPQPQITASPDEHTATEKTPGSTANDRYQTQSNNSRSTHRTTLIVIMLLAILCLIVLGGMMVVMNQGGLASFRLKLRYLIYNLTRRFRR